MQHLQEHEQVEHLHPVPDGAVDKREEVVAVTGISEEKYYISSHSKHCVYQDFEGGKLGCQ